MTLTIKNVEYFEWKVPEHLIERSKSAPQYLIDEHFNPSDISVEQISDTYYELEDVYDDNSIESFDSIEKDLEGFI